MYTTTSLVPRPSYEKIKRKEGGNMHDCVYTYAATKLPIKLIIDSYRQEADNQKLLETHIVVVLGSV